MNEIFAVNVIVGHVDEILARARAGDVINDRIKNDEEPKGRRREDIDEITDGGDRHAELDACRVGALIRITRDRLGEARADQTARDIDDLHRADREQKLLRFVGSHKSDGHINGDRPDHVNDDCRAKALIGKELADDLAEGLGLHLLLFFDLLIFHAHQTDEITDGEDQHHRGNKEESALDVTRLGKAVHRKAHGKADDDAGNEGDDLLGRREICAPVGIHVRISPIEDQGSHEVISEISDEQTANDDHGAELLRYMKERQQIKDQKAHLADTVNGYRHELDVSDMLNDEDGAKLEQKRKRDQRGDHADHGIAKPQIRKQRRQKRIGDHQRDEILKRAL